MAKLRVRLKEILDEKAERGEPVPSQAELAEQADISQSTMSRWIRNKIDRADLKTIEKLCILLKIDPGELIVMDWDEVSR